MDKKTEKKTVEAAPRVTRVGRTLMATKDVAKKGSPAYVEAKWYVADAEGMPLGRLASQVAAVLRGKNKPIYTPYVDCGDYVVVVNCDKAVLTGKKAEQKFHITHSKYIGGLKKVQYSKLMAENSDLAMTYAIKGMIPSNTIGAKALTRLHCYQGAEHAHAAQKPEKIEF